MGSYACVNTDSCAIKGAWQQGTTSVHGCTCSPYEDMHVHVYSCNGLFAGRQLSDNAPDLPWACTKQQLETARSRCDIFFDSSLFDDFTCIPSEFYGKHFEKGLGLPGALKSSEHLLLAGPVGKFLLQGCMHAEQQAVVYDYLDLLGAFWEKTFIGERLQQLETQIPVIMARLEEVLPAWELDMNRHMMVHLVESIRRHGPPLGLVYVWV